MTTVITDETLGYLFDAKQKDGLETALSAVREWDLAEAGRSAFRRAKAFHWEGIAEKMAVLYRS